MEKLGIENVEKRVCSRLLAGRSHTSLGRRLEEQAEEFVVDVIPPQELLIEAGERMLAEVKAAGRRKQQAWNVERTRRLGENPREARVQARANLELRFHLADASKYSIPPGLLLQGAWK